MEKLGRSIKFGLTIGLSFGAIVGLIGCNEPAVDGDTIVTASNLESENGLSMNGLSMNGLSMNGLSMNGLSMNGLSMNGLSMNGLATAGGLASTSGLMTTAGGREIVKYMVRCALPAGQSLTKQDQNGVSYTFDGVIGVAPEAATGTCDLDCQERISACMLAHVNNSGAHISIWLNGPDAAIGWGSSPAYPYQEGAFFGNLISSPWQGYYCLGKDMGSGEVPGRLGTSISSTVYTNPFGYQAQCKYSCTTTNEGYTQCPDAQPSAPYTAGHSWNHVVTVWRNFEATQAYKICTKSGPTRCLGVVGNSTADGANIEQRTYSGAVGQQWQILQVEAGKYKFVNVNSGKVLDVNGSQVVQRSYNGAASQKIPVVYFSDQIGWANLKPSSGSLAISGIDTADGRLMQLTSNNSPDYAKWGFEAIGTVSGSATTTTTTTTSSTFAAGTGYRIAPYASGGGVSVDVPNGSTSNGTMLQLYSTQSVNSNQRFQFMAMGSNYKIVMNANTNKCFDVGSSNGSQVSINDCNGGNSQSWTPSDLGSGSYSLRNVASGRCLDVPNGSLSNGTRLQVYDCQGGNNNQRFYVSVNQ
jgi:hypothetical protein